MNLTGKVRMTRKTPVQQRLSSEWKVLLSEKRAREIITVSADNFRKISACSANSVEEGEMSAISKKCGVIEIRTRRVEYSFSNTGYEIRIMEKKD